MRHDDEGNTHGITLQLLSGDTCVSRRKHCACHSSLCADAFAHFALSIPANGIQKIANQQAAPAPDDDISSLADTEASTTTTTPRSFEVLSRLQPQHPSAYNDDFELVAGKAKGIVSISGSIALLFVAPPPLLFCVSERTRKKITEPNHPICCRIETFV